MNEAELNYQEYLERYCRKHKISKEVAETHALVKEVKKLYFKENDKKPWE